LSVVLIDSNIVVDIPELRSCVLGEQRGPDTAYEQCRPLENILPKKLIERSVVYVADEIAKSLIIIRLYPRRRFRDWSQMCPRIHSKNCIHSKKSSDGRRF